MIRTLRSVIDPLAVVELVTDAYAVTVTDVVLLRSLVNDVYRIGTASSGPLILKIYRAGRHTVDDVAWEVALAGALGGIVAPGVPLADGRPAGSVAAAEGPRPFAMWSWASGLPPSEPFSPDLFFRYGVTTAHFHRLTDESGIAPRSPGEFDAAAEERVLAKLDPEDRAVIAPLAIEARRRLSGMELEYGICHGDVSLDNLHVDGERIVFYDLDRAGYRPRISDLVGVSSTPGWPEFMDGYRSVRTMESLEALPWLDVLGKLENLHFHLIDKPAFRGTYSIGAGWAARELNALRAAAGPLVAGGPAA
jgi:Ser/Thr protein kinase RdoA (MazF antagonist)